MREFLKNQIPNTFLWVPFMLAAGAAYYFSRPDLLWPMVLTVTLGAVLCFCFKTRRFAVLVSMITAGAIYAAAYAHLINTPQLRHDIRNTEITGRITDLDYGPDSVRASIRLDAATVNAGTGHATVRINIKDQALQIGDTIRAKAFLFRPGPADAPEAYDPARAAYFNHVTANGFATEIEVISHGHAALRDRLHNAANSFLADGLVLGYKGTLPESERKIWTTVGIGHVWSISGFHMTLVAGWLFAIFFAIFRCIPYITRRVPARIPAMICAWFGLSFYLILSGMGVATIRAFLMTSLVFTAFILSRNAFSMRNVALAFCAIFILNPYNVMQPGFQLSFSAVFGLVWFWNTHKLSAATRLGKIKNWLYVAFMTTVVATIFTAPFVAAIFSAIPLYGLLGNLILLPIFSIAIMPLVFVGTLCSMVGFMAPLHWAHLIYNQLLDVAQDIADLPFANIAAPHIPNIAMIAFITGLVCLMLVRANTGAKDFIMRKINYVLCVIFIACGVIPTMTRPRPLFYVTADHELAGFVYGDKLEFSKASATNHKYTFNTWRRFNNEATSDKNKRLKPDHGVWLYKTENFTVAYIQRFVPLQKNIVNLCRDPKVNYIVSYFKIDAPQCKHKILNGGLVIYPSGRVRQTTHGGRWHNPRR